MVRRRTSFLHSFRRSVAPFSQARAWPCGRSTRARRHVVTSFCPAPPCAWRVSVDASRRAHSREPWGGVATVSPLPPRVPCLLTVAGFPRDPAPVGPHEQTPCPGPLLSGCGPGPARLRHPLPSSQRQVVPRARPSAFFLSFLKPGSQYHGGHPSVSPGSPQKPAPQDREVWTPRSQDCFPHHRSLPLTKDFMLTVLFDPLNSPVLLSILIFPRVN